MLDPVDRASGPQDLYFDEVESVFGNYVYYAYYYVHLPFYIDLRG
jgi:hypothetical protein